jgi:hypothetical protein
LESEIEKIGCAYTVEFRQLENFGRRVRFHADIQRLAEDFHRIYVQNSNCCPEIPERRQVIVHGINAAISIVVKKMQRFTGFLCGVKRSVRHQVFVV